MSEPKKPEPMYPVDVEGAPEIMLGGKPWKVPKLAHGQNKRVVPIMSGLMPKIVNAMSLHGADLTNLSAQEIERLADKVTGAFDEKSYDDMGRAVFWGLKRAYPGLSESEFDGFPIEPYELLGAALVVGLQSGFFKPGKRGEKASGEPSAATPSTGTASPPASAASPDGPGTT